MLERLVDKRALAGAVALLAVGAQLTALLSLYFFANGHTRAIFQTRWFWELALNFQIFLLFLMWVCHVDRISGASGWRKVRAISRLMTGLMGVSTPFLTLIVCSWNNWFYDKPPFESIRHFAYLLIGAWVMLAYVFPLLVAVAFRRRQFIYLAGERGTLHFLFTWAPLLLFLLAAGVSTLVGGGDVYWVLLPTLVYLHGAMPYLERAFATRPERAPAPEAIDLF